MVPFVYGYTCIIKFVDYLLNIYIYIIFWKTKQNFQKKKLGLEEEGVSSERRGVKKIFSIFCLIIKLFMFFFYYFCSVLMRELKL